VRIGRNGGADYGKEQHRAEEDRRRAGMRRHEKRHQAARENLSARVRGKETIGQIEVIVKRPQSFFANQRDRRAVAGGDPNQKDAFLAGQCVWSSRGVDAREEPKVCRLSPGGRWIRTIGTAAQKPWISAAFRA